MNTQDTNANFLNHISDEDDNISLIARYPEAIDGDSQGLIIVNPETGKAAAFGFRKSRSKNPDFEYVPTETRLASGEMTVNKTKTEDGHPDYYLKVGNVNFVVWKLSNGGYSFRLRKPSVRKASFSIPRV